jgi:hypothetical protein
MMSAELVEKPPAAPDCNSWVAGSIQKAQGNKKSVAQLSFFLSGNHDAAALLDVNRIGWSTTNRSNRMYATLIPTEKAQKKTGTQKDHPYHPALSLIGTAVIPPTRLVVPAIAFSRPNAKANPSAPNQW